MSRLKFNSRGELIGVDGKIEDFSKDKESRKSEGLMTSASLEFLKESNFKPIFDKQFWSLYEDNQTLQPLRFSNGKTQEDISKEIVELIKAGNKVIFLHGVCGTGKSAIALNVARALGRASIIVPIKSLQKQYENDYMEKKYLVKPNGKKMKIAMITGRENHDSVIIPGVSCAHPFLPDTIKFSEKNSEKLREFYEQNPFISNDIMPSVRDLRRISVAPANPYWSPILPATIELNQLKDAKKKRYSGLFDKEYIFYHRKPGCSYYDQYLAYSDADVIIFNSAKYLAECALGRKPFTDVDIIDEADEFLDSFSNSAELNLTRFTNALKNIYPIKEQAKQSLKKISDLIDAEETNKRALGLDTTKVYHIKDTKILDIFKVLLNDIELETEIEIDEMNYANAALEIAQNFRDSFEDTYLTYKKEEENLFVTIVTTNLSKRFKQLVDGNNALVLMSGTLHSKTVLQHIFGIEKSVTVEAEALAQGSIEISRTGAEFDCKYSNLKKDKKSREKYLEALSKTIEKAERPALVHINAYNDLPSLEESAAFKIKNLPSREELKMLQADDKNGEAIAKFKSGKTNVLFTTKCSRGIDFPGEICRSVVFTKYPNPNVQDIFWRILEKTHPDYYWEFYKDKARREFLQRIYRAVRSKDDHVYVLSPDIRVLNAVRELQINSASK